MARRQDEMTSAVESHLARQCAGNQPAKSSLPLRLVNFLLLLVPFMKH